METTNMPNRLFDQIKELASITSPKNMDRYINKYIKVSFEEIMPFFAKFIFTINDVAIALLTQNNDDAEKIINAYYRDVLNNNILVRHNSIPMGELYKNDDFAKFMDRLIALSECGAIRSYFDAEAAKNVSAMYTYADSFIIFNFFTVIEELMNDYTGEFNQIRGRFNSINTDVHAFDFIKDSANAHFMVLERMKENN